MLLIFRLGRMDVLPATDYGVRKGFALVYQKKDLPKPAELLAHGELWRPFRSIAAWRTSGAPFDQADLNRQTENAHRLRPGGAK